MDNKPTLAEYIARQAGVPGASCPNLPNTYIGMRYVPEFADPVEWDATMQTEYEYLKIVTWQGNSYTSRTWVPKNIPITNTDYWILTGNYNAQVEAYRKEVQAFDGRITAAEKALIPLRPLPPYITKEGMRVALIGDSYTAGDGSNPAWGYRLQSLLGLDNSNFFQLGRGGAGMLRDGNNLLSVLQELIPQVQNRETITHFIIQSGANDISITGVDFPGALTRFANVIQAVKQNFPNAKIYVMCTPVDNKAQNWNTIKNRGFVYDVYIEQCAMNGVIFAGMAPYWLMATWKISMNPDRLHPNNTGAQFLAEYMFQFLNGCDYAEVSHDAVNSYPITFTDNGNRYDINLIYECSYNRGSFDIVGSLEFKGKTTTTTTWITIVPLDSAPYLVPLNSTIPVWITGTLSDGQAESIRTFAEIRVTQDGIQIGNYPDITNRYTEYTIRLVPGGCKQIFQLL